MNRWLLVACALAACHHGKPPAGKSATCPDVAAHVQQLLEPKPDPKGPSDHAKHIHDIFATRCTADKWAPAALTCMQNTSSLHDGHHCKDQLSIDQRRTLDADLDALERVVGLEKPSTGCERYKKVMDQLVRCDKLPQASRDAMKQAYDAMMDNAKGMSEDERTALDSACKAGADAAKQVGAVCNIK